MVSTVIVSVIVPVYNAERYLEKCLNSICRQSLKELEVIAVNDGSTDHSLLILENYAKLDVRIKVISQSNGGVSRARNAGISYARGEYVTFVDADDWIEQTMLEQLVKACEEKNAMIAKGDLFFVEAEKTELITYNSRDIRCLDRHEFLHSLFIETGEKHFGYVGAKIYRKSLLDTYKLMFLEDMYFAEDIIFVTKAVMKTKHICYVPAQFYYYNVSTSSSLTRGTIHQLQEKYDTVYTRLQTIIKQAGLFTQIENSFSNYQLEGLILLAQQRTSLKDIHNEITEFLLKYPNILKVKVVRKNKQKHLFLQLLKWRTIFLSSMLIYLNVKRKSWREYQRGC